MNKITCIWLGLSSLAIGADEQRYDFRTTQQYAALSDQDRRGLEQVHRDFVLLWGALDMYAEDHGGQAPKRLEDLVPLYLRALPKDPFASKQSANEKDTGHYIPSRDGWGYRYRPGTGAAWIISSVGLPKFPYLAERGNVSLYKPKGIWMAAGQLLR